MFEDLESVEWEKLEHAYGPATEIPEMIRGLQSSSPAERRNALDFFWCKVIHQGTVCSATPRTIPFLLRIVQSDESEDCGELLELMSAFAGASTCPTYPEDIENVIEQCRRQVSLGWKTFLALLDHRTERTRQGSALALSYCRENAREITDTLKPRIRKSDCEVGTACCVIVIGRLAGAGNLEFLLNEARNSRLGLVRFCACIAIVEASEDGSPPDIQAQIVQFLLSPAGIDELYLRTPFSQSESAVGIAVRSLCKLANLLHFIPSIKEGISHLPAGDTASIDISAQLLARAFSEGRYRGETLTELQRAVIGLFSGSDALWYWGNVLLILRQFGLPESKEDLLAILEKHGSLVR